MPTQGLHRAWHTSIARWFRRLPRALGYQQPGPSGSKSLGLSPTKACALLPTSIGSLGSHSQGLCLEFLDALGISLEVGSSCEPIEQVHILLEKQC